MALIDFIECEQTIEELYPGKRWKCVPDSQMVRYPYAWLWVSDHGDVIRRRPSGWCYKASTVISNGYVLTQIHKKNISVHRLVLEAFYMPRPPGMVCRHLDGNPQNNHIDNLDWGTYKDNAADRVVHGTDFKGMRHPMSKLTNADVIDIRTRHAWGDCDINRLAEQHNVHPKTIDNIIRRKTWKHI